MTKLDYDALRAQTLGSGHDEAVTVNTRALIDKVLARYSGEWTTLRELLQNAADASAKNVTVRFETSPSRTIPVPQSSDPSIQLRHVILHHSLKTTVIENDGDVFKSTDWARLKKIAEGNPDETKIGAFGVGFYSVFADCEEPFVSSGREALAFHWKGDALYTKGLQLPDEQTTNTTFMLPMRNKTSSVPDLMSLGQFLTSSLTFVGLEGIELWLDNWKILKLSKKLAPGIDISIPKELNRKTRDGIMHITNVTRESAQLDATWLKAMEWKPKSTPHNSEENTAGQATRGANSSQSLRSFFSRLAPTSSNTTAVEKLAKEEREAQGKILQDLLGECRATLFVHVNRAGIQSRTSSTFSAELERATKKPPPKSTSISLLGASYEESLASSSTGASEGKGAKIFEAFIPANGRGKIFIGFTTNQTTGLNMHISTPSVIPTVERESIDLNNRFVRSWNIELLRAAGIVARISWGHEMDELSQKLSRSLKTNSRTKILQDDIKSILPDAVYLHDSYAWLETNPSAEVGLIVEEAFWTCNQKVSIATLSTRGILLSSQVRQEPEEGLGFVESIPIVPQALTKARLIHKLVDYGVITEVTIPDIRRELEGRALNVEQLRLFMGWLAQKNRINEIDAGVTRSLLDSAVANDAEDEDGTLLVLADMKTFLNVSRIPPEMPIPPTTLPFKFTKTMAKADLEILGLEDLQMVPWLKWIVENAGARGQLDAEQDITRHAPFASAVLPVISKQWDGLSQSSKATVIDLLAQRTIIPTKMGMAKPSNAYFSSVKLFDDLPVVTDLRSVKDKFLAALGVRKTIDIGVVFDRLMNPVSEANTQIPASSAKWNHVDLIRYLTSVRADIPADDIKRLRNSKICPAEIESPHPQQERYLVSELFEPDPALRRLGLRTIQWPSVFHRESPEGRFLSVLGLRSTPSYMELVEIISKAGSAQDWARRDHAMKYFIDHHQTKGYANFDHSTLSLPYLPIQGSDKKLAVPSKVFVNERAAVLGFDILRRDLQVHALKFGVKQDPPVAECVQRLINKPPTSPRDARELFSYMASRVGELRTEHAEVLSSALIVPVKPKSTAKTGSDMEKSRPHMHNPPKMCFLGSGEKYADIFDFVDFGHEANNFLLACGSKHEPSTVELARRLIREPAGILSILGDSRYLELLRAIALAWTTLKKDKALVKEMRVAKCLLAYKEISSPKASTDQDDDEDSGVKIWELAAASRIVIVDDVITYTLFREALLAAPMEESLEDFYYGLGAPEVSSLLEEQHRLGPLARDQTPATKLQHLLLERTRLFLNDYPQEMIKHNFAWLQKHLTVQSVQSISVRRALRGYNVIRNESRSAIVGSEKPVLYITAAKLDIFEVSQALVPVLLNRSKPQHIFMLEMMLESSLTKLRSRGYNVDRILRAKAAEARVAEEARKKQVEEEQVRIKDQEAAWKERQLAMAAKQKESAQMPGVFPDSPDRNSPRGLQTTSETEETPMQRPRGLFSGISKHFNFDNVRKGLGQNNPSLPVQEGTGQETNEEAPPPYTPEAGQGQSAGPSQPEPVTAPHHLQRK